MSSKVLSRPICSSTVYVKPSFWFKVWIWELFCVLTICTYASHVLQRDYFCVSVHHHDKRILYSGACLVQAIVPSEEIGWAQVSELALKWVQWMACAWHARWHNGFHGFTPWPCGFNQGDSNSINKKSYALGLWACISVPLHWRWTEQAKADLLWDWNPSLGPIYTGDWEPSTAVCFFVNFVMASHSGDNPLEDLAKFGYNLNMKLHF